MWTSFLLSKPTTNPSSGPQGLLVDVAVPSVSKVVRRPGKEVDQVAYPSGSARQVCAQAQRAAPTCAPHTPRPGGASGSPTPEGPRAPRRPACPPSGTGRSGSAAGLPVPNWPAGSAPATRAPKPGSSSVQKREEVTEGLEEREAGPTSMPRSSPGGRQRWRRRRGSSTCVAGGEPAAVSGLGRLQTPREGAERLSGERRRRSARRRGRGRARGEGRRGARAAAAAHKPLRSAPGPGKGRRGARGAGPLPAARPGAETNLAGRRRRYFIPQSAAARPPRAWFSGSGLGSGVPSAPPTSRLRASAASGVQNTAVRLQ